ncbi:hypothetical protein M4951_07060 [Blastopirellula sp. J2-11]|uniref:hypothetical protein n=1 Tax=Blastopirellula sp. J2-11 TaxID=2943192 RepID=UPI0021CA9F84|nr:hypothetical protein [Blastopirellula sp. J2-11]UUO08069.1 hypothetical protein M4951_07060 [Blastopirellula sp. J2-11]
MIRIFTILTACTLFAIAMPLVADDATDQATLDQQLLEGLGEDLFDGLEIPDALPPKSGDPAITGEKDTTRPTEGGSVPDVVGQPDGEDLGLGPENPLVNIGRQMQTVQDRIGQGQAEDNTLALQRSIIEQLNDLIDQANQQQQQQQSQQQNQQQQQQQNQQQQQSQQQGQQQPQNGGSQPQPQEGEGEEQMSQQQRENEQANDSSDQVQDREYQLLPLEARGALIKEVWGQLPERVRQQLQNASVEKFLPKYERLTEEYFRRLAEQEQEGR